MQSSSCNRGEGYGVRKIAHLKYFSSYGPEVMYQLVNSLQAFIVSS